MRPRSHTHRIQHNNKLLRQTCASSLFVFYIVWQEEREEKRRPLGPCHPCSLHTCQDQPILRTRLPTSQPLDPTLRLHGQLQLHPSRPSERKPLLSYHPSNHAAWPATNVTVATALGSSPSPASTSSKPPCPSLLSPREQINGPVLRDSRLVYGWL